jgi:hypothetical protein
VVRFADYSPQTRKENEFEWTMSRFLRQTRNLFLTIHALGSLEHLFNYARAYYTFAALCYLRANPPAVPPADGAVSSDAGRCSE